MKQAGVADELKVADRSGVSSQQIRKLLSNVVDVGTKILGERLRESADPSVSTKNLTWRWRTPPSILHSQYESYSRLSTSLKTISPDSTASLKPSFNNSSSPN